MSKKKKKTKSLLPKRIAGVKVPKAVRKGRFGELLASKTGQMLIAEALMGAAALGAAKKAGDSPKARGVLHDAAEKIRHGDFHAGPATATLAYALGEAARSFADALRRGDAGPKHDAMPAAKPDPAFESEWLEADRPAADGDLSKKKPSSFEAGPA